MYRLLPILFLLLSSPVFAQLAEHTWFLGGGANDVRTGLRFNFNTNEPEPYNDVRFPLQLQENNMIISSDATGEVIFYSDGQRVVDGSHRVMPSGGNLGGTPSTMYGTSVVYDPTGCRTYFLFYGEDERASSPRKLYYSKIDLELPGNGTTEEPLGDVAMGQKNVRLLNGEVDFAEGLFALPKNDGSRESWLFAGQRNGNKILQFEVKASGVELAASYDIASLFPGESSDNDPIFGVRFAFHEDADDIGRLIISVSRKEVRSRVPLGFSRFNRRSGTLLDPIPTLIADDAEWTYGLAFSPDGSKLYISDYFLKRLQQYDFDTGSLTTVANSPHQGRTGALLLAPDNKIYWSNQFSNDNNQSIGSLSRINRPNLAGTACEVEFEAFTFPQSGRPPLVGALPTFGSFPERIRATALTAASCNNNNGIASVTPINGTSGPFTYEWSTGQTTDTLRNLAPGRYEVTVTDGRGCQEAASVLIRNLESLNESEFRVTTIDAVSCGASITTGAIQFTHPSIVPSEDYLITYLTSAGESISLTLMSNTEGVITLTDLNPGTYSDLTVTTPNGCVGLLPEVVTVATTAELEPPTILKEGGGCAGARLTLAAAVSNEDEVYRWTGPRGFTSDSSAIIFPALSTENEGLYTLTRTIGECESAADSFLVDLVFPPTNVGFDTVSCTPNILIDIAVPYVFLEWQDGTLAGPRVIDSSGTYNFNLISLEGCLINDSVTVRIVDLPVSDLSDQLVLDECETVTLDPGIDTDGSTALEWMGDYALCPACATPTLFADREGTIILTITDLATGCSATDSTQISLVANQDVYIPNAFFP